MISRKPAKWNRLDNAAKIFPPTSGKQDTKVFRFACELKEEIDPEVLQQAMERTLERFPFYRSTLKKGLFWYYLEESSIQPLVKPESTPPCSALYDKNVRSLLFEVTYFQNRINLEIYHALSDGTGALQFLRVMVSHYLLLKYKEELGSEPAPIDYDPSMDQRSDDSFQKYYKKNTVRLVQKRQHAYRLKGIRVPENRIRVIEGVMPVRAVIGKAHEYEATLTALIAAVFLCSISETMSLREKKRPVVLTIPVNMRQYFSSESARNFFAVFEIPYLFGEKKPELSEVTQYVSDYFKQELTAERMTLRMNSLAAIEHNVFARAVPRVIKDWCLRAANRYTDMGITAALSNIGKVDMPAALKDYIRRFDVFVSTRRVQICMCSFGDDLTVTFSSAFESTEVQKNFFRILTSMGIPVTVSTNPMDEEQANESR